MKQIKLVVIKGLSNKLHDINTSAETLGWSKRYTYRKLKEYKKIWPKAFIHKNTGKTPKNKIDHDNKEKIISLYKLKYYDFSMLDYWENCWKDKISYSSLRNITKENNELVFSMHRKTKKEIRLRTKRLKNDLESLVIIKNKIPLLKHPHPTQKRETNFGAIFEAELQITSELKE